MLAERLFSFSIGRASAAMVIVGSCFLSVSGHANEGEAAFKARCGDCHGARDIQAWGRQYRDAAERQAWLDQFLRRHFPPPEAERPLIVGYIQSVIAGEGTKK